MDGPGNIESRVVPPDRDFCGGVVGGTDFVMDDGRGREDAKAVGKSFGDEELVVVLIVERDGFPLHEGGRCGAEVDGNVPDLSLGAADELGLAGVGLKMESPDGSLMGTRNVVLDEGDVEISLPITFKEIAPIVFKKAGRYEF